MLRTGTDIDKIRQVSQHTAPRSPRVSSCRIRLLDNLDIPVVTVAPLSLVIQYSGAGWLYPQVPGGSLGTTSLVCVVR